MALRPILCHIFSAPLPYAPALHLQQTIHHWQLSQRRQSPSSNLDVILALQHRPVYTTGRRQTDELESSDVSERLIGLGADFVRTKRGGQTTFHGPGQLVIYPLLDLARQQLSVRDYICLLQRAIGDRLLSHHNIKTFPSEHTGTFLSANRKVASIGVEIRHRLTLHGLAMNVTTEPKSWFEQIVACGLEDVRSASVAEDSAHGDRVSVKEEAVAMTERIASLLGREILRIAGDAEAVKEKAKTEISSSEIQFLLGKFREVEDLAVQCGDWHREPTR